MQAHGLIKLVFPLIIAHGLAVSLFLNHAVQHGGGQVTASWLLTNCKLVYFQTTIGTKEV